MTRKIRIVAIPTCEAPLSIRAMWVGLEFPIIESDLPEELQRAFDEVFPSCGVLGGEVDSENVGGYRVDFNTAMRILAQIHPWTASWWVLNSICKSGSALVFGKKFCQLVE